MDFAFILDPLPQLKAYKDSSVAMMRALSGRGHAIFALESADLFWDANGTQARVVPLTHSRRRRRLVHDGRARRAARSGISPRC